MNRKIILLLALITLLGNCVSDHAQNSSQNVDLFSKKIIFTPHTPKRSNKAGETPYIYGPQKDIPLFQNTFKTSSEKKEYQTRNGLFIPKGFSATFPYKATQKSKLHCDFAPLSKTKKATLLISFLNQKGELLSQNKYYANKKNGKKLNLAVPEKTGFIKFSSNRTSIWLYSPRVITIAAKNSNRPPVIFIVVDAMRKDALTLLGGKSGAAPTLDRLAKESHIYNNAYITANWTRPSTLSFFTGKFAWQTGIPTTLFALDPKTKHSYRSRGIPTIASQLRKNGYYTRAIVNNIFMVGSTPLGLDMGFHHVTDYRVDGKETDFIQQECRSFIQQQNGEPFFLFVNFNAPHAPYAPPKQFLSQIQGQWSSQYKRYMAEVAYSDAAIGKIIQSLKKKNLYDKSMIIVTSDHGEILHRRHSRAAFFDYLIYYTHGETAYNEEINVPLLIKYPKNHSLSGHKVIKKIVRLSQLPVTIAMTTGITNRFPGVSLTEETKYDTKTAYFEGRMLEAIVDARYTYSRRFPGFDKVRYKLDGPKFHVPEELYDRVKDPMELNNLALSSDRKTKALLYTMRKRLFAHKQKSPNARLYISLPPSNKTYQITIKLKNGAFYRFSKGIEVIEQRKKSVRLRIRNNTKTRSFWIAVAPAIFEGTISLLQKKRKQLAPLYGALALPLFKNKTTINKKQNMILLSQQTSSKYKKRIHIWLTGIRLDTTSQAKEGGMSAEMKSMLKNWGYIQ